MDYIGKHEQMSVYDGILAEVLSDKESRMKKFMRTHEIRNDGKPVRKDKRKSYRKELTYSCDPWIGYEVVKHKRERDAVESRIADWEIEQESHAKTMAEIASHKRSIKFFEEFKEPIEYWFWNDDISKWTYEDGNLCYGARNLFDERLTYLNRIDYYTEKIRALTEAENY